MNCKHTEIVAFGTSSRGPKETFIEYLRTSWHM